MKIAAYVVLALIAAWIVRGFVQLYLILARTRVPRHLYTWEELEQLPPNGGCCDCEPGDGTHVKPYRPPHENAVSIAALNLIPQAWQHGVWYEAGTRIRYQDHVWECISPHRNGPPGSGEILWQYLYPVEALQ